jgi:hypothetical protein
MWGKKRWSAVTRSAMYCKGPRRGHRRPPSVSPLRMLMQEVGDHRDQAETQFIIGKSKYVTNYNTP